MLHQSNTTQVDSTVSRHVIACYQTICWTASIAANLGSNVHKHHGFGLPAQGVLQQLSQLAVAEGNVRLLVGQG